MKFSGFTKGLKQLASYYKPYKKVFFWDLFFSTLSSAIALTIPMLVRHVTDNIAAMTKDESLVLVLQFGAVVAGLLLMHLACDMFIVYYGKLMGANIEKDMRSELFRHYQKLSFSFFDNQKVGKLMSRITVDLVNVSELMHHAPEEMVISVARIVGAFVIFFNINYRLALVLLVMFLIIVIFSWYYMPKLNTAFIKNHSRTAEINAQVEDSLSGIKVVKSFANEDVEIRKFEMRNADFVTSKKELFKIMSRFYSGFLFFIMGLIPAIIVFAILFMINFDTSISDLITFVLYESVIVGPMFVLLELVEQFQESTAGYRRFREMMQVKPDMTDKPDAVELSDVQGDISFQNVSFHYKRNKNKNIVQGINLNIKSGEYIALVGASGSGKSTLCNLIPRFYDASEGAVLVDGMDVRDVTAKSLRKSIGTVQQVVHLFADTIYENIRYGDMTATKEQVIEAAKKAHAHEFIMNFPDGYNTNVGQRGARLSGGQRQRIAIARVFLKNPSILIFDEATSALDNESEQFIQMSMEDLASNRTTIVIAHRLSTIQDADRILVMDEGKIAEEGTHEELLKLDGIYAGFYNATSITLS